MTIGIEAQRIFRRKKHGMEIVALETINELLKIDTTNKYILFARKDEDEACIIEADNFIIDKFEAGSYPSWEQIQLPKKVKKSKADILHCTANTAPLFCKTPMIVTIHDLTYLESISFAGTSYQNFGNLYRRFIVPIIAKKAKTIITVSEYVKQLITTQLKVPEQNISVVYNGVAPQFRHITDTDTLGKIKSKYELPDQFLLHIGNKAPKKNTIGVLKAYKIYCTTESVPPPLVIMGSNQDFIQSLLQQIDAPEMINKIKILGYIAAEDIPSVYNLATIFLYPSFSEGFGMPVIEAMACGTPVVTANLTALPEIAGDAALLVDPYKPDEIFMSIQRLLNDTDLYNSKKKSGFENALRFSWRNAAVKTLEVYEKLGNRK